MCNAMSVVHWASPCALCRLLLLLFVVVVGCLWFGCLLFVCWCWWLFVVWLVACLFVCFYW